MTRLHQGLRRFYAVIDQRVRTFRAISDANLAAHDRDANAAGFAKNPLVGIGVPAVAESAAEIGQCQLNCGFPVRRRQLFVASRQRQQGG